MHDQGDPQEMSGRALEGGPAAVGHAAHFFFNMVKKGAHGIVLETLDGDKLFMILFHLSWTPPKVEPPCTSIFCFIQMVPLRVLRVSAPSGPESPGQVPLGGANPARPPGRGLGHLRVRGQQHSRSPEDPDGAHGQESSRDQVGLSFSFFPDTPGHIPSDVG